jgi:hypothetical protein
METCAFNQGCNCDWGAAFDLGVRWSVSSTGATFGHLVCEIGPVCGQYVQLLTVAGTHHVPGIGTFGFAYLPGQAAQCVSALIDYHCVIWSLDLDAQKIAVPIPAPGEKVEDVAKRQEGMSTGAKVATGLGITAAAGAAVVGGVILGDHLAGGALVADAADMAEIPPQELKRRRLEEEEEQVVLHGSCDCNFINFRSPA